MRGREFEGRGRMAKVLCVLYDDPVDGYPPAYARDDVPQIERYHDGQTRADARSAIDFTPGELLGCVSGELGLRAFLEGARPRARRDLRQGRPGLGLRARAAGRRGRHLPAVLARVPDGRADRQGAEAEARADRRASAPTTSTCRRRSTRGLTVAEVTYSNSISVAEHVVMMILALVRNYIPSYQWVIDGGWNIADCVVALLRPRGDAGRHGRRRAHRLGGAAPAEAVRGRPALHRPPPPAGRGRAGARR